MEKLTGMINKLETEMLIEIARKLMDDFREGTELVFDSIIKELESRLDKTSFIELMEEL